MRLKLPIVTLSVAAAALVAHVLPGAAAWLQFDRGAITGGEVWRWLTGHVTHFGANHLGWDAGVFLALGTVCERESPRRVAVALLAAAVAIPAALWWWQPQFQLYRGLSGLDCALGGLLAASLLQHRAALPKVAGALTLVFVGAKCAYEAGTASTIFAAGAGYVPVPLAHLVGLVTGALAALVGNTRQTTIQRDPVAGGHTVSHRRAAC